MLSRFRYAAAPPAAMAPAAPANMAYLPQRCHAGTAAASVFLAAMLAAMALLADSAGAGSAFWAWEEVGDEGDLEAAP